jgi:hypothetical protein
MEIMDIIVLKGMLLGAIALGSAVAGLFFLRFWNRTSDRLFLYFSLAFFLLALNRMVLVVTAVSSDEDPVVYLIRLAAYGLIIFAIVDKNRKKSPAVTPPHEHFRKI